MSPYFKSFLCLIFLLGSSLLSRAQESCMLIPASLEQRAGQAALIIEGKVIRQQARWDQQRRNIYTANLVEVYKVFKGAAPLATQVEILTEGGSVGNDLHVFSGTLSLQTGQQGLFFLEPSRFPLSPQFGLSGPVYSVYTSLQGFIRYDLPFDEAVSPFQNYQSISLELYPALQALPGIRRQELQPNPDLQQARPRSSSFRHPAARTQATPNISSFSPQIISAGTGAVLTITGSNFGATQGGGFVEFKNANNGGATFSRPQAADYLSWTENTIQVRVPSSTQGGGVAGSGQIKVTNNQGNTQTSSGILTVEFAISNILRDNVPYPAYHVDKNGAGGYTLSYAAGVPAAARQAFSNSLKQWTCQTAINWQIGQDQPQSTPVADDGINIIRFSAPGDIPANILGRTTSRYQGCEIGGGFRFFVNELDFEFNNSILWQFGPGNPTTLQFDFESVALHEQGHGHQLAHLILPRAVMHYAVARGQISRQLNGRSDVDGGNFVTQRSFRSNICGPARMAPLVRNDCPVPQPFISFAASRQSDGSTLLTWASRQEGSLSGYEVQRSSNGFNWLPLSQVDAQGGPYSFTDPRPFAGRTYYRLRLVYGNGMPGYSGIRQVDTGAGATAFVQLYPNPINEQLSFDYYAPAAGQVVLRILDAAGRQYGRHVRRVSAGSNPFVFDTSQLGRGFYLLQTIFNQQVQTTKFLKL